MPRFGGNSPGSRGGGSSIGGSDRGGTSTGLGDGGGRVGGGIGNGGTDGGPSGSGNNTGSRDRGGSDRGSAGLGVGLDGSLNGGFGAGISNDPGPAGNLGGQGNNGSGDSLSNESIRGSQDARSRFSVDSLMRGGLPSLSEVTNGQVAPSDSDSYSLNEALFGEDPAYVNALSVREDNDPAINLGITPIPTIGNVVKGFAQGFANNAAAKDAAEDAKNTSLVSGVPLGANIGDLNFGYGQESLDKGTFGLLGDPKGAVNAMTAQPNALRDPVAMGVPGANPYGGVDMSREGMDALASGSWVDTPDNNRSGKNNNDTQYEIPKLVDAPKRQKSSFAVGNMSDYGSYARKVFSNT